MKRGQINKPKMKKIIHSIYFPILILGFLFSITSCEEVVPDRDKFLGAFFVDETCDSGNDTYDITIIVSGSGENAVILANLYDWDEQASATVSGNTITIPSQLLDGITFSGSGTITDNILTINFSVSDGSNSDNCNAICTRK